MGTAAEKWFGAGRYRRAGKGSRNRFPSRIDLQKGRSGWALSETASKADAIVKRLTELLPTARYAHFATHGYFDAETLSAEQRRAGKAMESRQFGDETRRVAAKNPLAFTGLVFSGGEVLSGLNLVDLPLGNLRLVTLSACETGLGAYIGGEGVQGLQRAFHLAGCPNGVAQPVEGE